MIDAPIAVRYTNWRGETSLRRLILGDVRFGSTDWHPEPTWLISALDLDHPSQIWKDFDLTKCDFVHTRADLSADLVRAALEQAAQQAELNARNDIYSKARRDAARYVRDLANDPEAIAAIVASVVQT